MSEEENVVYPGHGHGLDADTVDRMHAKEILMEARKWGGGGSELHPASWTCLVQKPDPAVEYYEAYKNIGTKYTILKRYDLAYDVIQAALDGLTSGRTWKEKVFFKGNFSLSNTVILPSYTILDLRAAELTLSNNINKDAIQIHGDYIGILGGIIDGNKANNTDGNGIADDGVTPIYRPRLLDVEVRNFAKNGIKLYKPYVSWLARNEIHDNALSGIYIANHIDRGKSIINDIYYNGKDGFEIAQGGGIQDIGSAILANNQNGINWNVHQSALIGTRLQDNSASPVNTYSNIKISQYENQLIGVRCVTEYFPPYPKYDYEEMNPTAPNVLTGVNFIGSRLGILTNSYEFIRKGNRMFKYDTVGFTQIKSVNEGVAIFSGDGSTGVFSISHGLVGVPNYISVEEGSSAAGTAEISYIERTSNTTNVWFKTAPVSGSNNVILFWKAEM
jgi:hypothetical protein